MRHEPTWLMCANRHIGSRHTYEIREPWVISHIWLSSPISHGLYIRWLNPSVISHISHASRTMSHITHMIIESHQSRPTYDDRVPSVISHVSRELRTVQPVSEKTRHEIVIGQWWKSKSSMVKVQVSVQMNSDHRKWTVSVQISLFCSNELWNQPFEKRPAMTSVQMNYDLNFDHRGFFSEWTIWKKTCDDNRGFRFPFRLLFWISFFRERGVIWGGYD